MHNPLDKFNKWWQEALAESPLNQKSAVCVSTIDENGFPSGRFVDLKDASDDGFVFCSYLDSAKGNQISINPKAAMTFWWDHAGYQVRVTGSFNVLAEAEANKIWETRSRSAQLITTSFVQSATLDSESALEERLQTASVNYEGQAIPRPRNWGGYILEPVSMEFLTFRESRLHLREFYEHINGRWDMKLLQP